MPMPRPVVAVTAPFVDDLGWLREPKRASWGLPCFLILCEPKFAGLDDLQRSLTALLAGLGFRTTWTAISGPNEALSTVGIGGFDGIAGGLYSARSQGGGASASTSSRHGAC